MERNTFKTLFYVKKTRVAKNGEVPVLLRVTVNGVRAETSVNLKVNPKFWNAVAGRSIGDGRRDYEVNARLDTIRARVMQVHRQMELDGERITAQGGIDRYLGRDAKPVVMLLELFREHNEKCAKLSGNGMAAGTVERYATSYKHTADFIRLVYRKDDVPVASVDHKFIKDYEFYLRTERKCGHNSAVKYLKNFGKIIRVALVEGHISKNSFANIKLKLEDVDRDFLEDHEIRALIDKPIVIERLAQVRDAFVFCCFTDVARGGQGIMNAVNNPLDYRVLSLGRTKSVTLRIPALCEEKSRYALDFSRYFCRIKKNDYFCPAKRFRSSAGRAQHF